jgi:hypothetical protein
MSRLSTARLTAATFLVFVCSYLGSSLLWFPSTWLPIEDFLLSALPPSTDHNSPETALRPGEQLDSVITDAVRSRRQRQGRPFVLTAFDTSCRFAAASVPFWDRLTKAMANENVDHLIVSCSPATPPKLLDFAQPPRSPASPVSYLGACQNVAPRLGMRLSIVQYVVDDELRVVSAWEGMPTRKYVERNRLAQMRQAALSVTPRD